VTTVLAAVGDLVDDIVVRIVGPVNIASDTEAVVMRRRGGSAANVAAVAARLTGSSRLLAQVGGDAAGAALLAEMAEAGVDVGCVRRRGRTGSIVVLVDSTGERSFLTDPGSSRDLGDPRRSWLDGIAVLHVPLYSLADGPIARTATTLVQWAHEQSADVSIDLSSVSLIEALGSDVVRRRVEQLRPAVVFANADEARACGVDGALGDATTFVKRGGEQATVFLPEGAAIDVAALPVEGPVDTTGAGDAFAAGVLSHGNWVDDPDRAAAAGHAAAASLLRARVASSRDQ
jgi:sugar/nucleoside kinase (ribokinase family)